MACLEEELLTVVLNLSFQKGWITENEKLQIKTMRKLDDKKIAMLDLMNKMKCDDNAARLLLSMRYIQETKNSEYPEGDQNRFLAMIMSKLFENGLVSKEEILECVKGQLQDENIAEKLENLELTDNNSDDFQEFAKDTVAKVIKNPMLISPVIKCVLQYLNFEEIKTSRLICKEWASAALSVLIRHSKIIFRPGVTDGCSEKAERKGPVNFLEAFPERNASNTTFPFSTFVVFGRQPDNPWTMTIEELNYFFRNQQQYITELILIDLYLVNENWEPVNSFDVTPWISNSPMAIAGPKTKTKLGITGELDKSTKLSVHSSAFSNVKHLGLCECTVHLQDGIRISPISLRFNDLTFTRDGNQLSELCVNDVADFTKSNDIFLICNSVDTKTMLSLDLNGCHELECLFLSNIELINWTTSRWTVKNLILQEFPFTKRTQMQIQELHLRYCRIDISVLPQSLQKLVIDEIDQEETFVFTQQPTTLHNLKVLELRFISNSFSIFSQNTVFPNLTSLHVERRKRIQVEMDLAWLSTSVKILKLTGITIKNLEQRNLNLDKLVLRHYRLPEFTEMCGSHIKTEELVLHYLGSLVDEDEEDFSFTDVQFLDFLENQKSSQDCGQRIYVGGFNKIIRTKTESLLQPYLDGGEEYYVFENDLGRAIEREEFIKLLL